MSFSLVRNDGIYFQPITFNDLKISIQASSFHYCSPRFNLPSSDDYDSFEVALIYEGNFCFPEELSITFKEKSWAQFWRGDAVAPHMPREEVDIMLTDISAFVHNSAFVN